MRATDLAASLAVDVESVCRHLLPNGVRKGHEWCVGSVNGDAGRSLKVRLTGPKAGQWADFGGDESGDLIGLWQAARHCDLATACAEAERFLGLQPERPQQRIQTAPKRDTAPCRDGTSPNMLHARYGAPSAFWRYLDADGTLLGIVARYDPPGDRKQVIPYTWSEADGWKAAGFTAPRPLYGLDRLAARPNDPVLLVEGEKCADAAASVLKAFAVVTWCGGAKAVGVADWRPLVGRRVTCWPDADEAGIEAMRTVAQILDQPVRMVDPTGQPDGWDVADAVAEGWTGANIVRWCKERVSEYEPNAKDLRQRDDAPLDLFTNAPLPSLQPNMLPPAIVDYIFDQSELIGCDPCILAVSALVCCAAMTHDTIQLQPKQHDYTWKESARLWGTFVGDPSVKKTPPLKRAMAPLRKLDLQYADEAEAAMAKYQRDLKIHAKVEAKFVADAARTGSIKELDDPPTKPAVRQVIVQDTTTEALAITLQDNPGGVLCVFDELAGFFGSMDAYRQVGGKDRSDWLEAYNGGPKSIDRVGRGKMRVPNWSACILGGIQPAPMRAQAAKMTDDGLLQRFIVVVAQTAAQSEQDRMPNQQAVDGYRQVVEWLANERGDANRPVLLSEGARCVMDRVNAKLNALHGCDAIPLRMRYHLGKWQGLFVRLCLTYHCINRASMAQWHNSSSVDEATACMVERFMFDYLYHHLAYFYDDILGAGSMVDHVRWIAGYILSRGAMDITNRELFRAYKAWRNLPKDVRAGTLQFLELAGWITPVQPDNYGVPVRSWVVDERVHALFMDRAVQEKSLRTARKESISRQTEMLSKDE